MTCARSQRLTTCAPFRDDGVTCGTPTWIWLAAVAGALYVRGYNGQKSRWYQAAVRQKAGRIAAAGMTKEVSFEPVDGRGATLAANRSKCALEASQNVDLDRIR